MTFFEWVFILAKSFRKEKEETGSFAAERPEGMAVRDFHR